MNRAEGLGRILIGRCARAFSPFSVALQSRCIAAVPRCKFITSISSVYITRSISIDSLSEKRKKNEGIYSRELSIKTIILWRPPFSGETTTRQYRASTASLAKTLFHLSGLIPTVTTDRSINTRPHYQKMKMAVARSMLCTINIYAEAMRRFDKKRWLPFTKLLNLLANYFQIA